MCVNDAQINYVALELPMGGWKDSGLGQRHGAPGHPQVLPLAGAARDALCAQEGRPHVPVQGGDDAAADEGRAAALRARQARLGRERRRRRAQQRELPRSRRRPRCWSACTASSVRPRRSAISRRAEADDEAQHHDLALVARAASSNAARRSPQRSRPMSRERLLGAADLLEGIARRARMWSIAALWATRRIHAENGTEERP